VSSNRVTIIPTSDATIKTINGIGEQESQLEGIEFSGLNRRITLQDFADNDNDDDSNASDADFKIDEEYKEEEEEEDEIALEEEEGSVGNDDPDSQEDYFQNPIQQHDSSVRNSNEPVSAIIPKSKRGNPIPVVTLINSVTSEIKKFGKHKKKKSIEHDAMIEENLVDDDHVIDEDPKLEVTSEDIKDSDINADDDPTVPHKLESDLGPYWTLAHS
jgi:hypothetical protein